MKLRACGTVLNAVRERNNILIEHKQLEKTECAELANNIEENQNIRVCSLKRVHGFE